MKNHNQIQKSAAKPTSTLFCEEWRAASQDAYKVFAANLRRLLDRHGYSQARFAREMGVNPSTVTHWVKGTQGPNLGQLDDIARHFGLSISAIVNPKLAEAEIKFFVTPTEALNVLARELRRETRTKRDRRKKPTDA